MKLELVADEMKEPRLTSRVYMDIAIDQGVPRLVPVKERYRVEDQESDQDEYEEEGGEVHDAPPRKGIQPDITLCAGFMQIFFVYRIKLVEGRIIVFVHHQSTSNCRESGVSM